MKSDPQIYTPEGYSYHSFVLPLMSWQTEVMRETSWDDYKKSYVNCGCKFPGGDAVKIWEAASRALHAESDIPWRRIYISSYYMQPTNRFTKTVEVNADVSAETLESVKRLAITHGAPYQIYLVAARFVTFEITSGEKCYQQDSVPRFL